MRKSPELLTLLYIKNALELIKVEEPKDTDGMLAALVLYRTVSFSTVCTKAALRICDPSTIICFVYIMYRSGEKNKIKN